MGHAPKRLSAVCGTPAGLVSRPKSPLDGMEYSLSTVVLHVSSSLSSRIYYLNLLSFRTCFKVRAQSDVRWQYGHVWGNSPNCCADPTLYLVPSQLVSFSWFLHFIFMASE